MLKKTNFSAPLVFMHLGCIGIFFVPLNKISIILFLTMYCLHVFTLTAGFHRYFSHKSFKTSRLFQFILAFFGTIAAQKDPLWWASHHRIHHQHADTEKDPHSARHKGFWYAHIGWVMKSKLDNTRFDKIKEFSQIPELIWLNKHPYIPPMLLVILLISTGMVFEVYFPRYNITALQLITYGFFLSTVCVYHVTFCINSVAHKFGSKRFTNEDDSVNNWILAILAGGEGWHNNHHKYSVCARQGFRWWEIDVTYYLLKILEKVKIIWDVKEPPKSLIQHIKNGTT